MAITVYDDPILPIWYVDGSGNKVSVLKENQTYKVINNIIWLFGYPDRIEKVNIINIDSVTLYEAPLGSIVNVNNFVVDYSSGIIMVDESYNGKTALIPLWRNRGAVFLPANKVYDVNNGTVIDQEFIGKTLQDYIDSISAFSYKGNYDENTQYLLHNQIYDDGSTYICDANSVIGVKPATDKTKWRLIGAGFNPRGNYDENTPYYERDCVTYDNELYVAKITPPVGTVPTNTTYWEKLVSFKTIIENVEIAIQNAIDATNNAITATESANTSTTNATNATNNANTAAINAQYIADEYVNKGEYDNDTHYKKGNEVLFSRSSFRAKIDTFQNTPPTYPIKENTWWIATALQGSDGTGGDMFKSVYDINDNGIVDNSEKLGGKLPSEYVIQTQIKNSLTETVTGNALDSTKGKELKNEIDILSTNLTSVSGSVTDLQNYDTDNEYQIPTIVGQQIQISRLSVTKRLYFYLSSDLTGGNITVSLDNGTTSVPLKDINGNQLTSLSKGYQEVVDNTSFFTLRPRGTSTGGEDMGFFGKYTGAQLTLVENVKSGQYIYTNEPVQLELDNITPIPIDFSTPKTIYSPIYANSLNFDKVLPTQRLFIMDNGWMVTIYMDNTTSHYTHVAKSTDSGNTWSDIATISTLDTTKISSMCMDVYGTNAYILVTLDSTSKTVNLYTIDINSGTVTMSNNLDTAITGTNGSNCYLFIDINGKMHAIWTCTTSSYSTYYNIRYSSSADRSTFTTPIQITNSTSNAYSHISLYKLNNDEVVCLAVASSISTAGNILQLINLQSLNKINIYTSSNNNFLILTPTLVQKNDGIIYVSFKIKNSADTFSTLYYLKGYENGIAWDTTPINFNGELSYSTDTTYMYIVKDYNDNVYLSWNGKSTSSGISQIYYIKINSSGVLGSKQQLTNGTNNITRMFVCKNYEFFTSPILSYYDYNTVSASTELYLLGVYTANSNIQLIPSIDFVDNQDQIIAQGNGLLKSQGNSLKIYSGFVSNNSKGDI